MPYIALLITMIMFGSAFASSKFVVGELPFEVAACLRFTGGSIVLLFLSFIFRGKSEPIGIVDVSKFAFTGVIGVFAYNIFFFLGLSLAPSMDGGIIVPVLSPIITIIILLILGKEKISLFRSSGLALGLIGASAFLFITNGEQSGSNRVQGDVYFLLGAGCWAFYSIISKKFFSDRNLDPLRATTYATVTGTLMLLAFSLTTLIQVEWASISNLAWANIIYLSIGPTAIAYLFYFYALRSISASTATAMMFTVPIFGIFFSSNFLGESFQFIEIISSSVMLIGSVMATGIIKSKKSNKGEKP